MSVLCLGEHHRQASSAVFNFLRCCSRCTAAVCASSMLHDPPAYWVLPDDSWQRARRVCCAASLLFSFKSSLSALRIAQGSAIFGKRTWNTEAAQVARQSSSICMYPFNMFVLTACWY